MLRHDSGLYHVLCEVLKVADHPMTAPELFDLPAVRKLAPNSNRVSDYLGNLWRDKLLKREPAPRSDFSSARWSYSWKGRRNVAAQGQPEVQIIELPEYTITISITPKS